MTDYSSLSYDSKRIIDFMFKHNIIEKFVNKKVEDEMDILLQISYPIYQNISKETKITLEKSYNNKTKFKKRPYILYFLLFIFKKDKKIFDEIMENSTIYNRNIRNNIIYYIQNIDTNKYDNEQFSNWMNDYGLDIQMQVYRLLELGYINNIDEYKKEIYGRFTPVDIQHDIENFMDQLYRYKAKYKHYVSTVDFITENMSLKKKYLNIFNSRSIFMMVISNTCSTNHIKCWMSNIKKKIPPYKLKKKYGIHIGIKEVNSGSTYIGNCHKIVLWRKEEVLKVVIHEMLHCLEMDFHSFPIELNILLKKYMNIDKDTELKIFEAYVETWATILNTILTSIDIYNNYTNIKKKINLFINYEICFSCFQAAKILIFYGFEKFQDFFNLDKKKIITSAKIRQNSSIISYYIIRSALLFSLTNFFAFCKQNNFDQNSDISFLKFTETTKCFHNFSDLIIKSFNNQKYQKYINRIMKIIKNSNHTFPIISLRMTCIEFY